MLGTKILEEKRSKYNGNLRVVKTLGMGTYIQAEGLTQSGGIVESIWKSTFRQINKLLINKSANQPMNCLVLGLGGGTVAKLVKKCWPDAKITGVEIDPLMIELGKKYLDLDKANVGIEICDALDFLTRHSPLKTRRYDLVITDLYCGDKFPKKFETENYTHLVGVTLARSGIAVFNRLYYGSKKEEAVKFGKKLGKIFPKVDWFCPQANIMFLCSKQPQT